MSRCLLSGALIAALVVIAASWAFGQQQPVKLGVLEDTPGHYAGEPHYRSVRVVFYKTGDEWRAFPSDCRDESCLTSVASKYPRGMNWTVAFNGRSLGQVRTQAPDVFHLYSDIGQQNVVDNAVVPTVGKPSSAYSGWLGEPVHRPLVANSRPFFRDPDQWKPGAVSPEMVSVVRQQFRKTFPSVTNCRQLTAEPKPWDYKDENITIHKAYSSSRHWTIVELLLKENRCDGPPDDPFKSQWFAISPSGQIRSIGESMWLVDAGDYDNDGKAELLFAIDDYNRGGYKLFYDNFAKQVGFEFSYH